MDTDAWGCGSSGLKIVDCYGSDVYLAGDFKRLVINTGRK
jgi:hypothetical protein